MVGRICRRGAFDPNFGNDGRNFAALADRSFRGSAGERCFDDLDCCRGGVVFRTKSDYGAATVQNISNELKRSSAHHAVRIDAERDVVNGFAAMERLRNHQAFVFAPFEASAAGCGSRHVGGGFVRRTGEEIANHRA